MKKKSIAIIVLSLMLVLSLLSAVALADDPSNTTTATIAFEEGDLEFDSTYEFDDGMYNMDIDFGSQTLPAGATDYTADDGSHTLRILDARETAGGWQVTVEMSEFVNEDDATNEFEGTIKLISPTVDSNSNDSAVLEAEDPVEIVSAEAAVLVVTADAGLTHGWFDTIWAQADTKLYIDDDAAAETLVDSTYIAELTWTLSDA